MVFFYLVMGIQMGNGPKNKITQKKAFSDGLRAILRTVNNSNKSIHCKAVSNYICVAISPNFSKMQAKKVFQITWVIPEITLLATKHKF